MHRSGRTGRAGRKGVCVTLYSNRDRGMLQQIEQKTGNTLEWTGAPSPKSLLAASSQTAIDDAAAVDDANPNPHPIPIPNPNPNPNPNPTLTLTRSTTRRSRASATPRRHCSRYREV